MARRYPHIHPTRGFQHDPTLITGFELMRGHPTAPGFMDEDPTAATRHGLPSPGNGMPGIPRVRMAPESRGPGIPGNTPNGPTQPGVIYEGEAER